MKQLLTILLTGQLLFSVSAIAADTPDSTTVSKQYYYAAKEQFKDMLNGKEELSYEKSIFITENAYYENTVNPLAFELLIDFHAENINKIVEKYKKESTLKFEATLLNTEKSQIETYNKSIINKAIFSYLTDTTFFSINNKLYYQLPFNYSFNDPLGTINWNNTQVFNLLATKKGNCYALVSLFKIFSERLNSEAFICTTPGHIYIRHADHKGIYHNVELATKSFPGTGSLETLTYTTDEATKNGISLRELDLKQSVALNLVYLAKGFQYKFGVKDDDFLLECAELALQYDELNLNAMLLKAEVLEEKLLNTNKSVKELQANRIFQEYEKLMVIMFDLGYREMPKEMKDLVISRLRKEDTPYPMTNYTPNPSKHLGVKDERYATLSNGLFDEQMLTKPIEQYHRTMFDSKQKKIIEFTELDSTYNNYPMDLVVFAWSIDPLYAKYPMMSPYVAFANNPIYYIDTDGREITVKDPETGETYLYVANAKSPKGASAYVEKTFEALNYVVNNAKSSDSQRKIGYLIDSKTNVTISQTKKLLGTKFIGNSDESGSILFDEAELLKFEGGGTLNPAEALGHELDHAYIQVYLMDRIHEAEKNGDNKAVDAYSNILISLQSGEQPLVEEQRATRGIESDIKANTGVQGRSDYTEKVVGVYEVSSPTSNETSGQNKLEEEK